MEKIGEILGWGTGICFIAAILNFFVKRINRQWIVKLPKDGTFRSLYQKFMKFVVSNHRYFGLAAALIVAAHLPVQITGKFASVTGITAAALLVSTVIIGGIMFYMHKGKLIKLHRCVAFTGFAVFLLHLIFKR